MSWEAISFQRAAKTQNRPGLFDQLLHQQSSWVWTAFTLNKEHSLAPGPGLRLHEKRGRNKSSVSHFLCPYTPLPCQVSVETWTLVMFVVDAVSPAIAPCSGLSSSARPWLQTYFFLSWIIATTCPMLKRSWNLTSPCEVDIFHLYFVHKGTASKKA